MYRAARLAGGEFPRFSQPAPWDFVKVYRRLAGAGHAETTPPHIISIHVTSQLSGTFNSAQLACGLCPDLGITLIDSRTGSMGTGWIVLEAARAAAARMPPEAIVERAAEDTRRGAFFLLVPDLTFLHRAGRLGKARAWLGQALSVSPILCVRDGSVAPYRLASGRVPALRALLAAAMSPCGSVSAVRLAAVHVGAAAQAESLLAQARAALPVTEGLVVHAGATVAGALGPGTVGLCVLPARAG